MLDKDLNCKDKVRFGDIILEWLTLYKKSTVRAKTYDNMEWFINKLINVKIGDVPLEDINSKVLQEFFNDLVTKSYSYETIKKAKNIINSYMRLAVYNGIIEKNYMDVVILPPKKNFKNKIPEFLNDRDIDKFIKEATKLNSKGNPAYRYGNGLIFILYTGLRVGEALNLKWKDIDLERKILYVTVTINIVKNRNKKDEIEPNYITMAGSPETPSSFRAVPLCDKALYFIKSFKNVINPSSDEEYIFSTSNKRIVLSSTLRYTIKKISERANLEIENCTLHTLRYSFASLLFMKGVDSKTISEILGHSGVKVTCNVYIHLTDKKKFSAIKKLNKSINNKNFI